VGAWELRLLGPIELWVAGEVADCGPRQQRHTLAALAVDAGRPVALETLIDRVWDEPPPGARRSLQVHLARIRQLLEPGRLLRRSGGYALDVDTQSVDLLRFQHLTSGGGSALEQLREARRLWRGEPLAGLTGRWAEQTRQMCRRQFLDATVAWAKAEIADGAPEAAIAPLQDLIAENPLVEPLSAALMRAMSAAGRTAEALEHYTVVRRTLTEKLGSDPGAELQAVHTAILRGELSAAPSRIAIPAAPSQLPADVNGFVGRVDQSHHLDRLAADPWTIAVLTGPPGVGKTTLAVHWAHTARERFPDGQMFLNLRGFDPDDGMTPGEALRDLLDGLGAPAEQLPASLDAQAARYRSLLSGRRVLLVFDNVRDADQVLPLLPGTPTAMVVVTSRNRLTALLATNGAQPITVDLLSFDQACELFTRRVGAGRVEKEPESAAEIVTGCARLPLAVSLAAARARETTFPLAALASEFGDESRRLDALDAGDPRSRLRAIFSWSLAALSAEAARLFRLLGVHPGPEVSAAAAASLAQRPLTEARRHLQELVRANLLIERAPDRHALHDLLRAYAADLAGDGERDALLRLLDHYVRTAHECARLVEPARDPMVLPLDPAEPVAVVDASEAQRWQTTEYPVLLAVLKQAVAAGLDTGAWQLAWALDSFLQRRGHVRDRVVVWEAGLIAARRLGHRLAEAFAHRHLAFAEARLDRYAEADEHLRMAYEVYRAEGDRVNEARTIQSLGYVASQRGDIATALEYARRSLVLHQTRDHTRGQAHALNSIGWYLAQLGDHAEALHACGQALSLFELAEDLPGQAATQDSLGFIHDQLAEHDRSIEAYRRALVLYRLGDDHVQEAGTLCRLGDSYHRSGDEAAARRAWADAAEILGGHSAVPGPS
jgi:DNA-binding SARP family transcriptional activator/tetratricopeptide (TPR) repeat protein